MRFFQQSFHLEISSYSSDDLLNTCRICRDETVRESLISPCRCSGTLGKCHVHCLEKWLSRANKDSCEICGHVYQTMRLPRSFKEVSSTRVKTTCVLTNIYEPFKLFNSSFYWEAAWPSSLGRWCCDPAVSGSRPPSWHFTSRNGFLMSQVQILGNALWIANWSALLSWDF